MPVEELSTALQTDLAVDALVHKLGNVPRMLALPLEVQHWLLTTLREKLIKIGAKSSATVAISRSNLPRSQSREACSPTSCA